MHQLSGMEFKRKVSIIFCIYICTLVFAGTLYGASLPKNYYTEESFEGFSQETQTNPLLQVVDQDAPPMSPGDACPWVGCGGYLVHDPTELGLSIREAGLTCDNPLCPGQYYHVPEEGQSQFDGFPVPLDNEIALLLSLCLLYAIAIRINLHAKNA